ncbi:hypothetical protein [Streptomyces sp. NRRL F-4489]|uniref:hypothetical protein n=1 Tax=Streptomyces sp. NRRL F-4489 TaxID=1609095 RepID=UPI001F16657C|nr:hypothetical protein [Streptomyces sp. NRRL F-4489]
MPGDERPEENAAGRTSGPRHAAPRKPLLTRLHMPAGKAIAIAAMPSAVLMGMGLTPQMAIAKPAPPESPFRGGPCVSAPDTSGHDAKSKDAKDNKDAKDAKDKDAKDAKGKDGDAKDAKDGSPSADPSATPSPSASKDAADSGTPSATPSASATPSPSASATPEKHDGLLGGIGDALGGLFGVHKDTPSPSATPSPSPSATASKDTASKDTGGKDEAAKDSAAPGDSGKDAGSSPVKDVLGTVDRGLKDPSKTVNDTVHGAVGTVDGNLPGGGLDGKDASGKPGYPCVVENKQAGKDEQTPVTLADLPWHLESTGLTLRGLDYAGVVNVMTQNGHTKQALKFTADSIDIADLHQIVDDPASGKHYHVRSTPGSTSTIRGGKVTLYTERLQGNLFGLIPIVFDPEHPPPINVPFAYFSKVKLDQAGQFGGTLHVPGKKGGGAPPPPGGGAPPPFWPSGRAARQARSLPRWCTRTMLVVPGTPGGEPAVMIMVSPGL